jgi:hypothetical protein
MVPMTQEQFRAIVDALFMELTSLEGGKHPWVVTMLGLGKMLADAEVPALYAALKARGLVS